MDKANEITKTNEGIKTNENFKLLSKLETLVSYINNVLVNYPKYNVVLRNQIELTMYNLVECVHSYRISNISKVRSKNMNDFIIKLSMLDYYIRISYEKKLINNHKLKVISNYLLEIRMIAFGVIRSEKGKI